GAFLELVRSNVLFPADLQAWTGVLYGELPQPGESEREWLQQTGREFFQAALAALENPTATLKDLTDAVKSATGAKGKQLFMPLRAALTGRTDGPGLQEMLALMSIDTKRKRLQEALAVGQKSRKPLIQS
ncbi:MAG: hypothetical protein MUP90_09625, partial [Gammaproteobacteria bacterium]|nr:hypothetical protein [Gammaproteobacteria bacterium]